MESKEKLSGTPFPGLPLPEVARPLPPTAENLKLILIRALRVGHTIPSSHFYKRCLEREFDLLDAEVLIEDGTITSGPTYDQDYHSFQVEIYGRIDGIGWKLIAALDCGSDFLNCPKVTLISVHRKRKRIVQRK